MELGGIMKIIFIISILVSYSSIALAEDTKIFDHFSEKFLTEKALLLNLKYKLDDKAIKEVKFYGNRIDPNRTSRSLFYFCK